MIKAYIEELKKEQKYEYKNRNDILHNALDTKQVREIHDTNLISDEQLMKIRNYVLWLEWDEANASFEEWMIISLETLYGKIKNRVWLKIKHAKKNNLNSYQFIEWMEEIYNFIKE